MPRVNSTSFTDTGTPCRRPSGSPFITAISASRASRRATSWATRQKALRRGLTASMRARTASVSSTGESSLRRIRAAHSTAERQTTSSAAIEPGAGAPGPWGASDGLTLDGRPLTRLAAVDWTRVDRIPPLAEPARLPGGAGTALFNLLARLAVEQGVSVLHYDAPYPTEALFLTLLESFRYVPADAGDPVAAFARGELAWTPAPYDVAIERGEVWVQRRTRIEKIVVGGRAYYRPDWQGVRRLAPRAVRDAGDSVRASLMALGRVLEDHLVLAADGGVITVPTPPADPPEIAPLAPGVVAGLVATVVATSAAPLAPWIARAARDVAFEWGPVEADLVEARGPRVRLSHRLRRALADALRGRARADALAAALEVSGPPAADARAIAAAAEALAREAAGG